MKNMKKVYEPESDSLGKKGFDFCPGCGYGSIVLELAKAVEQLELQPTFIMDIGCVDFMIGHLPGDTFMGPHGRASAIASGFKRMSPDRCVIAIQGDGGFMSVGASESLHVAMRGENITIIVLNNGVLADTGGQFAPTTLVGAETTTTPTGRGNDLGEPLPFLEMLSMLSGVTHAERVALNSAGAVAGVGRALQRALAAQQEAQGLAIIEILSACPTHWRKEPIDALEYMTDSIVPAFPLGLIKGKGKATP